MDPALLVPLLGCLGCALSALAIVLRDPGHSGNRLSAALVALGSWWCLCQVLWSQAGSADEALALHRLSAPSWGLLGPLAAHVSLDALFQRDPGWRRLLGGLYALGAGFVLLDLGTPWLHAEAVPGPWGWSFTPGPLLGPFLVFTLACVLPAAGLGLDALRRAASPARRRQLRWMIVAIAAPLVLGVATGLLLPLLGVEAPRLGASSMGVFGAIVAWGCYRDGFSALASGSFSQEILEALPDGVVLMEPDGVVRSANAAMGRLLGSPPQALLGSDLSTRLVLPLATPTLREVECEALGPDAERIPVAVSTAPLHDRRGRSFGVVVVARDLRETVALREKLVLSGRLAAVGQLAAGIAHEINNPVAFVRANLCQLRALNAELRKELGEDERRLEIDSLLEESLDGVERTAAIVREVRALAEGGSAPPQLLDLGALLEDLSDAFEARLPAGVRLERSLGAAPPLLGSPPALRQAFRSLLDNAARASAAGDRIRVSVEATPGGVVARVEDEGCGIAPEDLPRIWDPFFTTRPVGEALGLGLTITGQIARHHQAEIEVQSSPQRGTRVALRFPRHP